ncbi:type VI secretion system contractile sheath large subunit [Stieleria sp. TO1_6]|uniref:type VI secretion system contractile sheath domain-containing protein n=1 Tax=Stieleria tagensis TaxID=2956795 RepID=UPI00209B6BE9|nr:type VI secretion system contractile sheath large subunit [Stieleria tagensis]MCO8120422.1 type VI secretion system contractile sheath large subunit [Stieleria tagensis]
MSHSFESAFQFGRAPAGAPRDRQLPLRILVIGNFSGRSGQTAEPFAERPLLRIDIDNFEQVLAKINPQIQIPLGEGGLADQADAQAQISISELDHFHPDHLYRELPVFAELADLRKRLLDPATFDQAAAKLRGASQPSPASGENESADQPPATTTDESDAATLERVLGQSTSVNTERPAGGSTFDLQRMIDQIVAPYVLPKSDPRQAEYLESVDSAVAGQLRDLLHHPTFQSLESAWRGLYYLVSQATTDGQLQVYLCDATTADLQQAGESPSEQLSDSALYDRLVTRREQQPWSVIVSLESFGKQTEDLLLLSRLGAIAAQSGGPLLAGAGSSWLNRPTWTDESETAASAPSADVEDQNWQSLRSSPVASWIGLAGPRFLLRMPYGAATDPIDSFSFEEINDPQADHETLLWGAPALFCGTLIATSFLENEWEMNLSDNLELDDFPTVIFDDEGEKQLKACSEVYLSERVAESLLDQGIMPLMSFKNRNAIRLLRFQSIADPLTGLSGPWA